jgi:integrase
MKLTAKAVASLALPFGKADIIHFDDDVTGLGFRLRTSGDRVRRSWIAQYRVHGRTRRVLIGSAETVNAEQARAAARKILGEVALGGDPQRDKQERRGKDRFSFKSVVAEYLTAQDGRVRSRTLSEARRYLTGGYFKPLHAMPIDQVRRRDVAGRLLVIMRENGASAGARARAVLSAMFAWAVSAGLVENNPVVGSVKPKAAPPRSRVLSDLELAAILRNCGDDDYGRILRLLAVTGCRRQEIGGMTWNEIDLQNGTWTLPPGRSKNGKPHTLALPPVALSIIESVPQRSDRDHLFGERADDGFTNWGIGKRALDRRLDGRVQPWRLHDIRRTVATGMADIGVAPHVIEAALNHISGHKAGVAGVYNRSSYEREVRVALARWADHIEAIVEGTERKVVALQRPA